MATLGVALILGSVIRKSAPAERPPPKEPWHAVSVIAGSLACPSALQRKGKRFLAADAPPIPLPDCATPWRCKCTYRHFADRRAGARRAIELGMFRHFGGFEQRRSAGRRADDPRNGR